MKKIMKQIRLKMATEIDTRVEIVDFKPNVCNNEQDDKRYKIQ